MSAQDDAAAVPGCSGHMMCVTLLVDFESIKSVFHGQPYGESLRIRYPNSGHFGRTIPSTFGKRRWHDKSKSVQTVGSCTGVRRVAKDSPQGGEVLVHASELRGIARTPILRLNSPPGFVASLPRYFLSLAVIFAKRSRTAHA